MIDKIKQAPVLDQPFEHIEINDLFQPSDFEQIVASPDVALSGDNDEELFENLFANNYRIVQFPGCTQNYREYLKWHREKRTSRKTNTSCEGFGVVLRLASPKSDVVQALENLPEFPGLRGSPREEVSRRLG